MANEFVGVSVVDPPGVVPNLAISVTDFTGMQHGLSVTLATARDLRDELDSAIAAAERTSRGRS